jgi:hypothetical protein
MRSIRARKPVLTYRTAANTTVSLFGGTHDEGARLRAVVVLSGCAGDADRANDFGAYFDRQTAGQRQNASILPRAGRVRPILQAPEMRPVRSLGQRGKELSGAVSGYVGRFAADSRTTIAPLDCCDAHSTSEMGQKRRFGSRPVTSFLPRLVDIFRARRHVSKVPILFSNSGSGCQALQRSSLPGPLFSPR